MRRRGRKGKRYKGLLFFQNKTEKKIGLFVVCCVLNSVYICMSVYGLCTGMHCLQRLEEATGVPGVGVTCSCELPTWVLGIKLQSALEEHYTLNHQAISLVPVYF